MSSNRFLIVLIIIFFYFSHHVLTNKEGMYLIVAPGTVRSDSIMHMSIALNNFRNSCWFNISLKSSENIRNGHIERLHGFQLVEVLPNSVKLVELQVSSLYGKRGKLEISGYRGIQSRDSAHINFEHNSYSVFIQTNKPKYKPGESVKFRVICIDHLTRPAQIIDQKIFVLIYDSQDYLMKHIADVKLVKGVFKGEFQISDSPVLGDWKIKVEIGGDAAAEKSFQVAKYVLPIFSVRILTKSNVAYAENKIAVAISAR
ncbi:thioester-containing protein 1 allele R1-like [Episyrphus balteatus]|uniref:thioester-containing protein 1 allele R1-like n=1 Tax=Episyrphus balteatus TaxID=286459 RepID=UPI002485ED04|nr:thioester-containing protein 1 allele R1-like [Episyrphus balteatus]